MNIARSFAVTYRYFLIVRGSYSRVFQIFVWASLEIILWGFLTKYLDEVGGATFSFTPVLLGAVVLWELVSRAQQGVSTPFLEDIWARNLLNFFASPLSTIEYIFGLVMAGFVAWSAGLLFVTAFASYVFGFSLWSLGPAAFVFLLILFTFGLSIGVFAISMVLRYGQTAEWFIWPIPTVIAPFVGVFYPTSILPQWMQLISQVLPVTYVFKNLRSIVLENSFSVDEMLLALCLDAILLILMCALFVRVYRWALKHGAIARYSAESFQ